MNLEGFRIDRRESRERYLLGEFIKDTTAPEVYFGRALQVMIARVASDASQKTADQ